MYGRHAEGVRAALTEARSDLKVQLNPQKPRRNSFEVTLFVKGEGEWQVGDHGQVGSAGIFQPSVGRRTGFMERWLA